MDERRSAAQCSCGHAFETVSPNDAREVPCPVCAKPVALRPPARKGTVRRATGETTTDLPPSPIPGYTFLKRIGHGGMGEVFQARQESLQREVAVKLLPPELAKDRAYVEHFMKEARSAGKLSHENIVGALDVGEAGGRYYFIMEYVPGETLWDHVRRTGPMPERRALEIARQVARGLKHAQSHGFIHRDIKPKNILLTPEGVAKICDFGLARTLKEEDVSKEEGFLHVTPSYASPEQCRAAPNVDHRSDIYSLGISLFEMLTGKRPFGGATSKDIMKAQATAPPPSPAAFNPAVSAPVCELVLRMLAKKPDDRFKSYDVLLGVLDAALNPGGETPVRAPGTARVQLQAAEDSRRKKMMLAAGAGAAVVLILLVVLLRSGPSTPPPPPPDTSHLEALKQAKAHQDRAAGIPGDLAAARARWAELEARYRGTPHHPAFSAGLRDSDSRLAAEASRVADGLLADADDAVKEARHLEALRLLRAFPEPFARLDAGLLIGKRALEIERALDEHVRAEAQACLDLSAAKRFDQARQRLHSLRLALVARLPDGSEDLLPAYKPRVEDVQKRIDEEQAAARAPKKPEPAVVQKPPSPPPDPAKTVKTPPDPAKTPDPAVRPPRPRRAGVVPVAVLASLRDPAVRADPARRAPLATLFKSLGGKSFVHRALALFLSRPEEDWALSGVPGEAFETYLASPDLDAAEALTPAQHAALLAELAQSIAASGRSPTEALQLFAVAHASEIAAARAPVDPAVAQQARLARGPLVGLWGPAAAVGRVELAGALRRAAGPTTKPAETALAATDFPTRFLGGLLLLKESMLDPAEAEAAWRKLGASAPDPGWSKVCEGVAERIQLAATCEACAGQGRYPCGGCGGLGAAACPGCRGLGKVPDGAGGHNTCTACRGKKIIDCTVCQRAKILKCAVCDAKKTRATVPGSLWRYVEDLGLCGTCEGAGSGLADTAWPCAACEGWGRRMGDVPADFDRLPAWTKAREGRAAWMALRWLARHQSPEGAWEQTRWTEACRAPRCQGEPSFGHQDVGLTALVLQTFLGAGWSGDTDLPLGGVPAGQVVRRGLTWLLQQQQADGRIGGGRSQKPVLDHLLATWTLCTALQALPVAGAAGDQERAAIREAASRAARWAVLNQARGGGWGYSPGSPSTTWVSSWGAQALGAARELGLDVPKTSLIQLLQWFDQNTDRSDYLLGYQPQFRGTVNLPSSPQFLHHETLSLLGGLARMGIEGRANATAASAEKMIVRDLPNADPLRRDYAYWSLGTMFLAVRDQRKGGPWTAWSQALLREVLTVQETADACALGSIQPTDRWSAGGGRVYATAMIAFGLEYAAGIRPLAWPSKK